MNKKLRKWRNSNFSAGITPTEEYLVHLAKRTFLSLWSYPNLYTDQGRQDKGDGKELCDLLIVFGNNIIIFSDKSISFLDGQDVNLAWQRWYRKAIDKSVKQLVGAENWIKRYPERIFLDANCSHPFPIKLPSSDNLQIHLIAVANGSCKHAKSYWGGSSSDSLMIDTSIVGDNYKERPFSIGWPLSSKRFVHIFDENTLDLVLKELDTVYDFIDYLNKKERLFTTEGITCVVPGEEELLAMYLSNFDEHRNEHYFPELPKDCVFVLREGDWQKLIRSSSYKARLKANQVSYIWDNLIDFHSDYIVNGDAISIEGVNGDDNNERLMRMMASETRLIRRALGEAFLVANKQKSKVKRFTRTLLSSTLKGRAYVVMSIRKPKDMNLASYLALRRRDLILYADGCKLKNQFVSEVIGIVFEPGQRHFNAIDFFFIGFGPDRLDDESAKDIQDRLYETDMWNMNEMKSSIIRDYPLPKTSQKYQRSFSRLVKLMEQLFKRKKY